MADDFTKVMEALWSDLGLGRFRAGPGRRARLTVEGRPVVLAPTPDGAGVLVTVAVGRLAPDRVQAAEQLRHLTRHACGLILLRGAALRLDPASGDEAALEAQAIAPCRVAELPALSRAVEDALFMAETAAPLVQAEPALHAHRPAPALDELAGAMIFRP